MDRYYAILKQHSADAPMYTSVVRAVLAEERQTFLTKRFIELGHEAVDYKYLSNARPHKVFKTYFSRQ